MCLAGTIHNGWLWIGQFTITARRLRSSQRNTLIKNIIRPRTRPRYIHMSTRTSWCGNDFVHEQIYATAWMRAAARRKISDQSTRMIGRKLGRGKSDVDAELSNVLFTGNPSSIWMRSMASLRAFTNRYIIKHLPIMNRRERRNMMLMLF